MNPIPVPNDKDNTAVSSQGRPSASSEPTAIGSPTDATIVKTAPSAATVADAPAATNFGKYELLGEIARGGMGVVYRARQHGLDRTVALKMILGTGTNDETAQRFLQEARAAAALDHPNVVPIYDIDKIGDRPYFTMALIDGPNLRGHVDAMGVVPIPVAVALFAQIVAGVAHAHHHGIIHRDLKPANVLIDKDGRPRVTDFGLAKRASAESQLTVTGQVVGTPNYMAPEQARESKDAGPPADVYALGAILYFLLTNQAPFTGESIADLLIKVMSEEPVPPSQLRPDVPPELEALCLRCLAKKPGDRFANADELSAALAPIADQHLSASAGLSPSLARLGLSRPSTSAFGSVPDLMPTTNSGPFVNSASVSTTAPLPVPAEPPAPAPNRRPLVIGLAAVAVVLVGAAVFFATRDPKKDEVAKQEPPLPKPVGPPGLPPGPQPLPVPPPGVVPPVGKNTDKGLPPPSRADFGLKVELEVAGAKRDAAGVLHITADTPMKIHLRADKDCRVMVWFVDPAGRPKERLFPNDDDSDDRLTAGKERVVPGNEKYTLETTVTEGAGLDRIRVFATTGDLPEFPPGTKAGRFAVFTDPEADEITSTLRGVTKKKAASLESEAEVRLRVQK